jgi:dTDP-glucose pyrophosphorylase
VINSLVDNYKIIPIENYTDGAAVTCLLANQYINNDKELVIANSDQIMNWKVSDFLKNARNPNIDGLVVVYRSRSKKNSYAKVDKNGFVSTISEKVVISSNALTGIHYWRKGSFFVSSAKKMIEAMDLNKGEYYVGPTYNYLISSSSKIGVFKISNYEYFPVGTPRDLIKYERQNGLI